MHEGHRARMFQRLAEHEEGLQEHELLEMLLYNVIPRKNTNDIAHRLLRAFNGLNGVFAATVSELMSVEGVGKSTAEYLRLLSLIQHKAADKSVETTFKKKIFNCETFKRECCAKYQNAKAETILLCALDEKERFVIAKSYTNDKKSCAYLKPEAVTQFIAAYRPKFIVMMHNHVNAFSTPSVEDDQFTRQINLICMLNNVTLYDHVIVGTDGAYSYYTHGEMDKIRAEQKKHSIFTDLFQIK